MSTIDNEMVPVNYVLKFFLSAFIFLCIMAVQYLVEGLNSYFNSLKFQDFMDLCSVANISILIMDQYYHGYYIHGEAPWGRSDLVMSELKEKLDNEGKGQERGRGLHPDQQKPQSILQDEGIHTYEIFFPAQIREQYDEIY